MPEAGPDVVGSQAESEPDESGQDFQSEDVNDDEVDEDDEEEEEEEQSTDLEEYDENGEKDVGEEGSVDEESGLGEDWSGFQVVEYQFLQWEDRSEDGDDIKEPQNPHHANSSEPGNPIAVTLTQGIGIPPLVHPPAQIVNP